MFNVGPMELLVLAVIGFTVLGPNKLPGLARDAARMIRTLREMATDARTQLHEELGPEFKDVDLRSLHPRTAMERILLGQDDAPRVTRPANEAQPEELLATADEPVRVPAVINSLDRPEKAPYDHDAT